MKPIVATKDPIKNKESIFTNKKPNPKYSTKCTILSYLHKLGNNLIWTSDDKEKDITKRVYAINIHVLWELR